MIDRYSREEFAKIWSTENRFAIFRDIEIYACEAMVELGIVPKEAIHDIQTKAKFDVNRVLELEKELKHDIIAFLTNLSENIGDAGKYLHYGMTSSDILDTALSVQCQQAGKELILGLEKVLEALKKRALEHKYTLTIGRSHGIHAEPTTFGLKLASHYAAFERNLERLKRAVEDISICAISGAVGTFANVDPYVQKYVANKMGLSVETISTQIIPRDRHAHFCSVLGIIASSIENFAVEVRHLQRTEMMEAQEYFSPKQKGSSAMPHKKNPILSENLTGLARLVRSAVIPALENVALWHERDISHSSVERVIFPDATVTLDFALHRLVDLVDNLIVHGDKMEENLNLLNGAFYSQRLLLQLIDKKMAREDAYRLVQTHGLECWTSKRHLRDLVLEDAQITSLLSSKDIEEVFDIQYYIKHVDTIFDSVF